MNKIIIFVGLILTAAVVLPAQVAENGNFRLEQTAVAAGGQTSTQIDGSTRSFSLTGTIGQAAAGTNPGNAALSIKSGFLTADALAPTAASVEISGRVLMPDGSGLPRARVTVTDAFGNTRTAVSNGFGRYGFDGIEVGHVYVFTVASKQFSFAPQILLVTEETVELNFVAGP